MSPLPAPSAEPSAAVRREAAVWMARIHSPRRSPALDEGLRQWLKESPQHQRAFELANEVWDTASRIPDNAIPRIMRWGEAATRHAGMRPGIITGLAASMALAIGLFFYLRDPMVTTGVGEQRIVTLEDGTRVSLNTATRMVVQYDSRERRIRLEGGEAIFDVARQPERPFVVHAGHRKITALGTTFLVRQEHSRTAVTLVDGKVAVADTGSRKAPAILLPGERLTFVGMEAPSRDIPRIDKVTAWKRGLVALDETRLGDAVAEMNRYSDTELAIDTSEAAAAPISGVFRAGDSLFFAQAVARTYDLDVSTAGGRIVISGIPRPQGPGLR